MDDEEFELKQEDINKLQRAGNVCKNALGYIIPKIQPGVDIDSLCRECDLYIVGECNKLYKKIVQKGVAHPTTISVGRDLTCMSKGTVPSTALVRVYVASHFDGWTAHASQTIYLGEPNHEAQNLIDAVVVAGEVATHLIKPEVDTQTVIKMLEYTASVYGCKFNRMITSHESVPWLLKTDDYFPNGALKFEVGRTYNLDFVFSLGSVNPDFVETDTNIYYRNDKVYRLKTKAGRQVLDKIEKKYVSLPFRIDEFQTDPVDKLGIAECMKNGLIEPFEVLYDETPFSARYSLSIIIGDNGVIKTTGISQLTKLPEDKLLRNILNHSLKTLEPFQGGVSPPHDEQLL